MNRSWPYRVGALVLRHKFVLGICALPMALIGFLALEHVRGSLALSSYLRELRARGEILSASEFHQPFMPEENGAPEVLAAARNLRYGAILPKSYPPRMRLTPAGHAVVCFREEQWVEDKATNHWEQLSDDLMTNAATLKRIRAAMSKPVLDCGFDLSLGSKATFPHLVVPKSLTLWFGSSVALGLHEGKTRETTPDLVTEIDLSRMLARDGIIISELVRMAIAAVARADTWEALQADGWTDEDLARLQQAWEKQDFADAMARALAGERIFAESSYLLMRQSNKETTDNLFALQTFLPDEQRGKWQQTLSDLTGGPALPNFLTRQIYCPLWRFAWMDQDHLRYLKYLQGMIELARRASRDKSLQKLEPDLNNLLLEFQNRSSYDRLRYFNEVSIDSLARVLNRSMRAQTERSLVLAAIAIKRYTLRHGRPPSSLSTLVPEIIEAMPMDYMDGQPLRFHAQPDGGFVLYSVGQDGKDDGGDANFPEGKTNLGTIWDRKDWVWPAPATEDEVRDYRAETTGPRIRKR